MSFDLALEVTEDYGLLDYDLLIDGYQQFAKTFYLNFEGRRVTPLVRYSLELLTGRSFETSVTI